MLTTLPPDEWRTHHPFSSEIAGANVDLLASTKDKPACEAILSRWLQRYQPCLFGRIAAQHALLQFCILTEADLVQSEEHVAALIEKARTRWHKRSFDGSASGFVILAISDLLIKAAPSAELLAFARRLAELYLLRDIVSNVIYLDEAFLEIPGRQSSAWRWEAGVNYFGVQADGRWWHDHRIPGGVAFSVNSVGQMARSGALSRSLATLRGSMGVEDDTGRQPPIESLEHALVVAMQTISKAADTVSGPATELLPLAAGEPHVPPCPVELPRPLQGKDYRKYCGWYDTDETLPAEYFRPDILRPDDLSRHSLDFRYLFDKGLGNPAFSTMGQGRRIRADADSSADEASSQRTNRMLPVEVDVSRLRFLEDSSDRT